ncbi:uncharacterized protein Dana_GF26717, isoform H [Drosophila ananassae]|uniref:Uncharacterized protein, isoform H n=1 Tax=Drosophila ananassae TaxID=7217 RepID=A0A0P9AXJ4_DROAN|nr:uncharacterized protein Dana_GF26717, isoform H [Drosophila ananassae]
MSSGWVKYITGIRRRHVNKDFWTGFRSISHRLNRSQVLMAMDGLFACILTWSARSIGSSSSGGYEVQRVIFSSGSRPRHLYLRRAGSGSCTQSAP